MATNTRWLVEQYLIRVYGMGRYLLNDATATATTIRDDSQFGGPRGDSYDVGADIKIRQNSVGDGTGTYTYYTARAANRAAFATGVITLDALSAALAETPDPANNVTDALILDLPFRWEDGDNHMNAAIQEIPWVKQIVPITLVTGGDMLTSTTSEFTNGGTATLAKGAGSFTFPRYLSLTGSGSSQYVEATNIAVEQGESYYTEIIAAKASASDGTLTVRDVTGSTTFTLTNSTIDERVPICLINEVTMNATTEQLSLRVAKADGGGTQTILVFAMILRKNNQRIFTIQDRPAKLLWLGEVRATSSDRPEARAWTDMWPVAAKALEIDAGVWQYHVQENLSGMSVWYEEFVQPAVLTADSDTTAIPIEELAAVTAEKWLAPFAQHPIYGPQYQKAVIKAAEVRQRRNTQQMSRQESQYAIRPRRV